MLIVNRGLVLIYFFCEVTISYGQGFDNLKSSPLYNVDYNKDNSKEVKPIRELFSKYNLVLLAESTHYDGATIDAQCMIMKELIDSGIINTIYTESSWLNAENIMSILLKEGKAGIPKAKNYATSGDLINWVDNDFWIYLADKIIKRKVRLVGFDIETTSPRLIRELFNEASLKMDMLKFMDSADFRVLKEQYSKFSNFVEVMYFSKEEYQKHCIFIDSVKEYYNRAGDEHRVYQWTLIEAYFFWIYHRQFSCYETNYKELYRNLYNINISYFQSTRDSIMAAIFMKDYAENKNVKAIIKTSAYHSLRNYKDNSAMENLYIGPGVHIFNDILNKTLKDSIYSICFVAASGYWGLNFLGHSGVTKIKAPKRSLENYFKKSEYPFFFSGFQDTFDKNNSFIMRVVFNKGIEAKWAKIFSGLFFIKEMYPIKYLHLEKHISDESAR